MSRGLMSFSSKLRIATPARRHSCTLAGSSAGIEELYGRDIPRASRALDTEISRDERCISRTRVCRKHPAARPGARARGTDDVVAFVLGDETTDELAIAFEGVTDVSSTASGRVALAHGATIYDQ
ncbi:hypothetical protein BC937DRAFT_93426 [Endogone sp. FLAS-F59071]|nr:hypothetical protein BC937DRAFT_93426 [Endogone sp. FLAS-F59071]|eukprot:RUS14728.1 hypothetical protein BC937DRAFT_93426 [Endogone sp. FLAS-F59071]